MRHSILLSILGLMISCSSAPKSCKVVIKNTEMLYGEVSREQLFYDYPFWEEAYKQFQPDSAEKAHIAKLARPMEIKIFFGTWCGDSRRNVPHFLKIVDGISAFNIKMVAVDRDLDAREGNPEKWRIKRVPTFIFIEQGREIGRIVENPVNSLEKDMIAILREENHE